MKAPENKCIIFLPQLNMNTLFNYGTQKNWLNMMLEFFIFKDPLIKYD